VGTTLTVQLLAFRVYDYAVAVVGIGVCLYLFPKSRMTQGVGQGILGFGLVFWALKIVADATAPFKDNEAMHTLLGLVADSPFTCLLVSALLTVVLQHSAATLGIALAMSTQGLLPIGHALPIVLGANIGTGVLPLIASTGHVEARRLAVANLIMKCAGAVLAYVLITPFGHLVAGTTESPARQIANAHTFFNIALAVMFLLITPWLAQLATRLVSPPATGDQPFGPKSKISMARSWRICRSRPPRSPIRTRNSPANFSVTKKVSATWNGRCVRSISTGCKRECGRASRQPPLISMC
jgi:phosphate:Na+ symporter